MNGQSRAIRLTASTGDHCPRTGLWWVRGDEESTIFAYQGTLMPTHQGLRAEWSWTVSDPAL
ncbi:hypothetical protein ACFVTE_03330 [Arthrobacter sp. NPDC058097]|uniref:hypothetical protein n=1 Tax=Arthrobacter sp. NPDC058097 TaxID=3346340 RepID=UPI0036DEF759